MTISDAQGNLHAQNGRFTHKPASVDTNAHSALNSAPSTYRAPEALLTSPLSLEELGYRTDEEGRVSARMALSPHELNTETDHAWDAMGAKFAGEHGYLLTGFDFKPISVNERSEIICDVSTKIILDDSPTEEDLARYRAGQQAQAQGVEPERIPHRSEPLFDASLAATVNTNSLYPVPDLPEGFEDAMVELGYNKHTGDPEVRLHWSDSIYKHSPSVDGYSDSFEEHNFGRPVTEEQLEEINEHVYMLGKNYVIARNEVMSNLERSDKFNDEMIARITAGGTREDYF